MYDAIVVGARCAGAPTAMLLARAGYRVLMLDRSSFPSDIMSTHYIQPEGVAHLQRWGLLGEVVASNCPPITKVVMHFDGGEVAPPFNPDLPPAYCPRRKVLDDILVRAAAGAGAELRERVVVDGLTFDGETVTGVRAHTKGGGTFTERARIVVGADGMHSVVAAEVKAPAYDEHPSLTCVYYSYFSGVPLDGAEIWIGDGAGCLAFPTNDGLSCIAVGRGSEHFEEYRSDYERNFYRYLDEYLAGFAPRVRAGKREEPFIGTADVPNFFRKPYGDGWALVGDAGYHKDPVTGLGIMDAFRDAQLLADAIDAGFAGRQPLAEALAGYEEKRNTAAKPMYDVTVRIAMFPDPSVMLGGAPAEN
jgi:flavin-dependent dehydrogenase